MKAIMYHYVREDRALTPKYYYLDLSDFRNQLDHLQETFGFVDRQDFLAAVRGNADSVPSGVVLTFDDGLRDHYDVVFPELKRRNLWGIFYVPTAPFEQNQLLDVHRIHILLSKVPGSELLSHTVEVVDEDVIPNKRRDEYRKETYRAHDDTDATKQAKRILNYFVDQQFQTDTLDTLVDRLGIEEAETSEFYLTCRQIREMHNDGMIIGAHTVTHPVLSTLDESKQRQEISESFDLIDGIVGGLSVRTLCYPYGHELTYDKTTLSILESVNCEFSFKLESTDISEQDVQAFPHSLPRYDCNEFPFGEASGSIGPDD